MHYLIQVRALAEIGTEAAGRILERQLHRRLTDDQLEQSWYWIDLANGLRSLNRAQSLPYLLRCAEAAGELPLGHFFAAETICFLGFAGYLRQPETSLGRAALRVLHRALEGLRSGVQPGVVAEARVGELVESLWDHRGAAIDPESDVHAGVRPDARPRDRRECGDLCRRATRRRESPPLPELGALDREGAAVAGALDAARELRRAAAPQRDRQRLRGG